ncbi:MAG: hypothetical protein ACK5HL_03190 [Bacilli bacterium]
MKEIDRAKINEVREVLSAKLYEYVSIIINEYSEIIPQDIIKYLNGVRDFKNVIRVEQTNTISMFVNDGIMYFPTNAFSIIDYLSKIPGYGLNKNHKTFTSDTLVLNDNTYLDYIIHMFVSGLTPLQFYEETLLHETTHLCGVGGASAMREGFAELKTRELAEKYSLKTSACGYPKEVKIALEIQNIFGKDIGDRIAFSKNDEEIMNLLTRTFGTEAATFLMRIQALMETSFEPYYSKNYPGIIGPLMKTREYDKIDYRNVHELIQLYKGSIEFDSTRQNETGIQQNRR